jgi:hypothetical protein
MRTDEEIIAQENMKFVASVLLEIIEYMSGKDLVFSQGFLNRYYERLKDISENGNSI